MLINDRLTTKLKPSVATYYTVITCTKQFSSTLLTYDSSYTNPTNFTNLFVRISEIRVCIPYALALK